MWWRMYSGHNCTNYAAYRMVHSGLPNTRPWTGSGNATNWGSAMSRITNSTPAVGSVAWWRAGVRPAGRSGHVAYVERVVSANEISFTTAVAPPVAVNHPPASEEPAASNPVVNSVMAQFAKLQKDVAPRKKRR